MKKSQTYISLVITATILSVVGTYAQQAIGKTATTGESISVNEVTIPQARINAEINRLIEEGASPEEAKTNLLRMAKNRLIELEAISQEAQKRGLEKNADVVQHIAIARQAALAQALMRDYLKNNPISDADLKKEYEAYKAELGNKEYKPRHILVANEDEAKAIIIALNKGGNFAKIAEEKSSDEDSKDKGGELGWGGANRFEHSGSHVYSFGPAFVEALKLLPKGQITRVPVKSNFGYHIIKMDDVRDAKPQAFEELKVDLRNRLQQSRLNKLVEDVRSKAKVVDPM